MSDNYNAIVAKVDSVENIPNADRIQIAKVLGETVIVSKDVKVGDVGVFFTAGSQLSEQYAHNNNLYRDSQKNINNNKSGFFDDNLRVRAQPFLKVRSDGYFAELDSLAWTGYDLNKLEVGTSFGTLNGKDISKKYINPKVKVAKGVTKTSKARKNLVPDFSEHLDTSQFKYNVNRIKKGDLVSIQAKVHGTSARYGMHKVKQVLPKWKEVINSLFGDKLFDTHKTEYVVGTRRVVLDNPEKEGFHGKEGYRFEVMDKLKPYLKEGMTVYGEIAGYANGSPIMSVHKTGSLKNKAFSKKYGKDMVYKYGCLEEDYRFHVYRITFTTSGGDTIDFTQKQLVQWCNDRGFIPALDLVEPFIFDGDRYKLRGLVEELTERPDTLTEDYIDPSHVSEGVIVRVDTGNTTPMFLKNKSYAFKVMEGIASETVVEVEDEA